MPELKKRVLAGVLSLALGVTAVACDGDEDGPAETTAPGGTETTEPVGS